MTKGDFVELIQRSLAGGEVPADVRGKYHENIVEKFVDLAFSTFMWELVKASIATRDFTPLDVYTRDYYVAKADIKIDASRGQQYIDLPAPVPQLLGNNAIRYVGAAKEGSRGYLYRNPSSNGVYDELDVNLVDQTTRYSPENGKVYFLNFHTPPASILLKLVTSFDGFDDNDEFPLPGGQDLYIFPQIVELLRGRPDIKEETRNDNVINSEHPEATSRRGY